jgi:hypothetical protein
MDIPRPLATTQANEVRACDFVFDRCTNACTDAARSPVSFPPLSRSASV